MATATDLHVLTLAQWLSPAFPVGAFAYSHGLEWLIETGDVSDAPSMETWLRDILDLGGGRADIQFLAAAWHAPDRDALEETDALCRAFASSAERLRETTLQGEAFCRTVADVWHRDLPPLTYPIAVGHAARLNDLPLPLTAQMYLQAVMSNLVAAGMRLIPLGQTDGQRIIHTLTPLCADIADDAITQDLSHLSSTTFLGDIAAMKHETQHTRIFRT
ncbi:MAG: urease accessory protein UreF [Tateyamaria sp.]